MGTTRKIAIDELRTDGCQLRTRIDLEHVERLAEAFADEGTRAVIPPVQVLYDSVHYWVWDGNHRILGSERAGLGEIACYVEKGTEKDAILRAAGANSSHGLPRTSADKRKAVSTLLSDKAWRRKSDRWIANTCNVSRPLVAEVRAELEAREVQAAEKPSGTVEREGRDGKTYSREPVAAPKAEQDVDAWLDSDKELPVAKPIASPVSPPQDFPEKPTDRIAWAKDRFGCLWDQYQAKFGEDAGWIYFSAAWEQFKESAGYE